MSRLLGHHAAASAPSLCPHHVSQGPCARTSLSRRACGSQVLSNSSRLLSHKAASTSGREVVQRGRARALKVQAALFEPPPFQPSKLTVQYLPGTSSSGPAPPSPRCYTLTHNDITGDLRLSIGPGVNASQVHGFYTRLLRDEIVAQWRWQQGSPQLHVHCHVSGEERWLAPPQLRNYVFRREMTLVLDTFCYAERELLASWPKLAEAPVYIHFQSHMQDLDLVECWGVLGQRTTWQRMPARLTERLKLLLFGFPNNPRQQQRRQLQELWDSQQQDLVLQRVPGTSQQQQQQEGWEQQQQQQRQQQFDNWQPMGPAVAAAAVVAASAVDAAAGQDGSSSGSKRGRQRRRKQQQGSKAGSRRRSPVAAAATPAVSTLSASPPQQQQQQQQQPQQGTSHAAHQQRGTRGTSVQVLASSSRWEQAADGTQQEGSRPDQQPAPHVPPSTVAPGSSTASAVPTSTSTSLGQQAAVVGGGLPAGSSTSGSSSSSRGCGPPVSSAGAPSPKRQQLLSAEPPLQGQVLQWLPVAEGGQPCGAPAAVVASASCQTTVGAYGGGVTARDVLPAGATDATMCGPLDPVAAASMGAGGSSRWVAIPPGSDLLECSAGAVRASLVEPAAARQLQPVYVPVAGAVARSR